METNNSSAQASIDWGTSKEWLVGLTLVVLSGIIAKIPYIFEIDLEWYFPRNVSLIVFPTLTAYFIWRNKLSLSYWIKAGVVALLVALYMNVLPGNGNNDTFVLACLHIPIVLWAFYGYGFTGNQWKSSSHRVQFLRHNGEMLIMGNIIFACGGLFSGITIGLFNLIGFNIEEFYFKDIAIWGMAAVPIVTAFLVLHNQSLANKIAPIIAKLFTPFVLLTLLIFSLAVPFSNRDLYQDRELLLILNVIVIAVMAIIMFSLSENMRGKASKFQLGMLFVLTLICILDDAMALMAIGSRLFDRGISPNRVVVVGMNLIVLVHLLLVSKQIWLVLKKKAILESIEEKIAQYLPVYVVWAAIVGFLFPLLFGFS